MPITSSNRPSTLQKTTFLLLVVFAVAFLIATLVWHPPDSGFSLNRCPLPQGEGPAHLLDDIYQRQLESYRIQVDALNNSLKWQALLLLISIAVIRVHLGPIPLASTGLSIPVRLVRLGLPLVVLYFWLQFGFYLDATIDGRIMIVEIINARESVNLPAGEPLPDYSVYSAKRLLGDRGLVYLWFHTFSPQFALHDERGFWFLNLLLLCGFAVFSGLIHARMFALATLDAAENAAKAYYCFVVLLLVSVALSHVQFYFGGPHKNWFHFIVFVSAIIGYMLMIVVLPNAASSSELDGHGGEAGPSEPETVAKLITT